MKTRVIVSVVVEKDDKLLFGIKQKDVGPYPNTYHLLGGGQNEDESLIDAAKREVLEEAEIEVEIIRQLGFDEDVEANKHGEMTHYVFLVYLGKYVSGELKAGDDIVDLVWVSKDALDRAKLNRPTIRLFEKLGYL